ncbi:MAG: hypothetical protein IJO79_03565 [Firmicutes bacterium]|nr:hypothetical protein [Bacillota bacterium]
MKQLVVLLAMIVLGIAIYGIIAGDEDGSIKSTVSELWQQEILLRQNTP